jgi:hypothetical protein
VVAALVCAVAASSVSVTGEASNHRAIPPGDWVGVITFFGDTGTASGGFEGSFELQSAGGAATGQFGWEGLVATAAAGDVFVTITGEIGGDTTSPLLTITGGTSGGSPIPDVSGGGNLVITGTSCNGISGRGANWGTAARITDDDWYAVRAGAAIVGGSFLPDLRALRLDAIETVQLLGQRDTSVLTARINRLVSDATQLLLQLNRGPECQRAEFRSLIGSAVEDLVKAILEDPSLANAAEYADVVLLALSAGTWGPGATDPDAFDLEVAIIDDFNRRVDDALATADVVSLVHLESLAYALGFTEVRARIATALDAVGR